MARISKLNIPERPRRNRASRGIRSLVREHTLLPQDFIYPVFVINGKEQKEAIHSMPGMYKMSIDYIVQEAKEISLLGIPAIALFPSLDDKCKDKKGTESKNPNGLLQKCIKEIKNKVPDMVVITDVALDPYSSDGHDGLVKKGKIQNDDTLPLLADMAIAQARAGADIIAPSDMMDGRVGYIREALDQSHFEHVGILAYSVKYCSAFYGPFRDALKSAPRKDKNIPQDKKTYQMDPCNIREALREVELDVREGADMVMVKPALAYLDVVRAVKESVDVPVAAYNVSGEYAMIKAAAKYGWIDEDRAVIEMLSSIKRAGADMIISYFAKDIAKI